MSKSLTDRARLLTKRFSGSKGGTSRPRPASRTRLTLEALEERTLLSISGTESIVQSPLMEAGRYAVQEVVNYISSVQSTVAMVQQMVVNLEQQALHAASRMETMASQTVEQFIQQTLFPTFTETNPSGQSSSMPPGKVGVNSPTMPTSAASLHEPTATPVGEAVPIGEASPAGGPGQPNGFSPSQISQAYGFNQITFSNGTIKGDGTGQTIAIVDAYNQPNIASDLQTFDTMYGIAAPPSLTIVNQNGGSTLPADNVSWGTEESLDVEWAHAMAPGANIVLVEATSGGWLDLQTAINYARSISGVSVVSSSWTWQSSTNTDGEFSGETSDDSSFTTPSGHTGVTFVAATGDNGTGAYEPAYTSTSPNVLAVGGTVLTTADTAGDYQSETGWSGSGGGISAYEAQPNYQKGVVTQSSTMRTVPDVSLNASGYAFYDSYGESNPWLDWAGTSFATPIWAALVTIADQGRALNNEGSLDGPSQTLPALYQMPSSNFHDITTGSNGAYSAGTGYDLVTGRGTPIANLVVNSLVSYDSWQQVPLSSSYNQNGLTWGGRTIPLPGIDGSGDALEGYTSFTWQGNPIYPGTPDTTDVVAATGKTININSQAGQYSTLTLFATAVNGNQTQNFTVNYSSGPSQTFTRTLTNWLSVPGGYSDELEVKQTHAFNSDGTEKSGYAYFSAYALPLDPTRTVTSITLPNDPNIVILAMELT